jgi:hypothetical protein
MNDARLPFAFAAAPRPVRNRLGLKPHRPSLLRLVPAYAGPRLPLSPHYVPIDDRFVLPALAVPNQSMHLGQPQYPHSACRTPSEPGPRFSPLRLLGRLPPEPAASSVRRQASENPQQPPTPPRSTLSNTACEVGNREPLPLGSIFVQDALQRRAWLYATRASDSCST